MCERDPVSLGDWVILKPQQLLGRVDEVDWSENPPIFVFKSFTTTREISISDTRRWRPLMTKDEASEVERLICTSEVIEGVIPAPGAAKNADAVPMLDKYLTGGRNQRITAKTGDAIRVHQNKVASWPWGLFIDACGLPIFANGHSKHTFVAMPFFLL